MTKGIFFYEWCLNNQMPVFVFSLSHIQLKNQFQEDCTIYVNVKGKATTKYLEGNLGDYVLAWVK